LSLLSSLAWSYSTTSRDHYSRTCSTRESNKAFPRCRLPSQRSPWIRFACWRVQIPSHRNLTHQRACQWVGFVPCVARLTHFTRVLRSPQNGIDVDHRLCVALRLSPHWPCNRRPPARRWRSARANKAHPIGSYCC
jgi:hypothetical protein